ncbi:MAG: glycosyltransferase family 4 protein [Deltaproteobacteria bacterium]|nr:glycosyltransferase family 4 protein [Deltaproteobacteria bacterium]
MDSSHANVNGLHLVVDGMVYGFQKHGGINTYFNEVISRLARRRDVFITLLLPYRCRGKLPKMTGQIFHEPLPAETGWSWKLDQIARPVLQRTNELVTKLRLKKTHSRVTWPSVFQSTYFTISNDSVPQVALAYDMNHELFPEMYQGDWGMWLRSQYRAYLQHATRIIAISQKTKNDVMRFYGIPSTMIDIVYPAVNREVFRPEPENEPLEALRMQIGSSQPYLLYVGGRGGYKNFGGLLEGFAQSSLKNKLHLVVAGKPWRDPERERIHRLGLESRVCLVTHPSDERLRVLYSFAAAFVYPSFHEGFGIPLLEAMACGTPVLASDTAVFREVAGNAAVYFDPDNPADLTRVLEISLTDSVRAEYVARGFEQAAKYSWEKCAEQTLCVYQKASAAAGN